MANQKDDISEILADAAKIDLEHLYPADGSSGEKLSKEWCDSVTAERLKQHIVDLDINSMYWQGIDAMAIEKGVFSEAVLDNLKEGKPIIKPTRLALVGCVVARQAISNPEYVIRNEPLRADWVHYTKDIIFPVIPNFRSDVSSFLFVTRVNNHRGPNRRHKPCLYTRDWKKTVRVLWWKRDPIAFKDRLYFRPDGRYPVGKVEVQEGKWGSEYIHEVM